MACTNHASKTYASAPCSSGAYSESSLPRPPQKTIRCRHGKPHYRKVNTELHDALFSLGTNDRTAKLTNAEFNSQLVAEMGYLFNVSAAHFGNALKAAGSLVKMAFGKETTN